MKKILILSDLSFWPCIICSLIRLTPLKNSEIKFKFIPEENFAKTLCGMAANYDILIGIGYEGMVISNELLALGEKLLILSASKHEDEFIPYLFAKEFPKENLNLMATIIEIANGRINADLLMDYDPEDLANILNYSEPDLDQYFEDTKMRYDQVYKVVHSIYSEEDEIKFHQYFFRELVDGESIAWIEEALEKYEPMEKETERLIKRIHPCQKIPSIGLLRVEDPDFFEDEVLNASEEHGYLATAIEYRDKNGDYVTIRAEKCSENMNYFPGRIKKNWSQIISRLN